MSSKEALRACFAMSVLLVLPRDYVGEVCRMTGDHRAQHLGAENVVRRDAGEIAIEHDEVGHHAGCERSFVGLAEFCVSRALRIGVECLRDGQLLFRKIALRARFVLSRHGGVDAAEGRDGFDRIVSAEGKRHTVIEEALPCVGVARALVAETLPIHGPATIQCFRTAPGRHEVTDVNPRFGGAFPLPLAAAAHQLFLAAAAGGHGAKDDAFVIRVWQALAGIELPEQK